MFKKKKEPYYICNPMDGRVALLAEVGDEIFAKEKMGVGVAIYPEGTELFSPVDGKIIFVFPAKHAVGIETSDGIEIFLHVGIDTVQMQGEGFEVFVKEGQEVKQGEKLLSFDKELLEAKGYNMVTLLLFANRQANQLHILRGGMVKQGESIIEVEQ